MRNSYIWICGWWRFFWRYVLLFVGLLLGGGWALNLIRPELLSGKAVFGGVALYGLAANLAASLIAFALVLNRPSRSRVVLLSSSHGGVFKVWAAYFWRFLLLVLLVALIGGALLPLAMPWFGIDARFSLRYAKFIGYASVLPASFLAFRLLIGRTKKSGIRVVYKELSGRKRSDTAEERNCEAMK